MSGVRVDNAWKIPSRVWVRVDNAWKIVALSRARVNDAWRITTFGAPPAKPQFNQTTDPATTSHVATGVFRIRNYDSTLAYSISNPASSRSGSDITLTGVNSSANVTAAYAVGAPQSDPGYIERRAYTFTAVPPTCTPNPPSCNPNCAPAYDCGGPDGFPGCIPCWGYGPDGSPGADGTICCGGSRGATCNPTPPTCTPNPPSKNPTPAGYLDSFGEWWRVS